MQYLCIRRYQSYQWTPAPDYKPGNNVYLDANDISTTQPSWKLSHQRLGPFTVEQKIGNGAYWLRLPLSMKQIHPVFNMVKLTLALNDPIVGRWMPPPPPPEIIDGEEEWVVEDILDSKLINQKLQYLVKWKDFGMEHNSWEPRENVHAPDIVADFYQKHLGVARHIQLAEFFSLPFQPTIMPRCHDSEGGVDVRGHHSPTPTPPAIPVVPANMPRDHYMVQCTTHN